MRVNYQERMGVMITLLISKNVSSSIQKDMITHMTLTKLTSVWYM